MARPAPGPRLAFDFYCVEQLVALGWKWPLRLFARVIVVLYLAAVPVVLALATLIFRLVRAQSAPLESGPHAARYSAGLFVVGLSCGLYVGAAYLFRELYSKRRHVVAHAPNRDFFRGLDISAADVFLVYSAMGVVGTYLLVWLVDIAFVSVFRPVLDQTPLAVPTLLVMPVALSLVTLAASGYCARASAEPRALKASVVVVLALLSFGLAQVITRMVRDAPSVRLTTLDGIPVRWITAPTLAVLLVAGLAAVPAVLRSLRTLRADSFAIEVSRTADHGRPIATANGPLGWFWRWLWRVLPQAAIVTREIVAAPSFLIVRRVHLAVATVTAVLLGVYAAEPVRPLLHGGAPVVTKLLAGLTFVACSAVTQAVFTAAGPTRLRHQLRFAWENGLSDNQVVLGAVVSYAVPVLGPALLVALWCWLLVGGWPVAVLVLGVGIMLAALTAESLAAVSRQSADGSSEAGLFVALLTVVLSLPLAVAAAFTSGWSALFAMAYVAVLLGGGITCAKHRVRTHPSESAE